jgi:hypothetical protein
MPPKLKPDRATPTMAICLGLKKGSRSFLIDAITYFSWYSPIKLKYKKWAIGSQAFDKRSPGSESKIRKTGFNVKSRNGHKYERRIQASNPGSDYPQKLA